jgi:ATP-dependent Clp protease protease subunit
MARINKDALDHVFDYGVDLQNRIVYIGSAAYTSEDDDTGVDWMMRDRFIRAIHLLENAAPNGDKPIQVYLATSGGDVYAGMGIYDAIRLCKNHVTITVVGECFSMGCIILQAADTRQMTEHSVLMFHEGTDGYGGEHPEIIRRWVKFTEKNGQRLDNILAKRIREKHPEFKDKKFKEMNVFDTIMTAEEALHWGLIDNILTPE